MPRLVKQCCLHSCLINTVKFLALNSMANKTEISLMVVWIIQLLMASKILVTFVFGCRAMSR
jgi:hypothetical protein